MISALIHTYNEEKNNGLARYLRLEIQLPKADFYRIPRKNIIFGKWMKHTGWWPDYQIRFFKKGKVTWSDEIHSVPQSSGKQITLEGEEFALIHHHYTSIDQFLTRMQTYTS